MKITFPAGVCLWAFLATACAQVDHTPAASTITPTADAGASGAEASGPVNATVGGSVQGKPFAPQVALFTPFTNAAGRPELLLVISDQNDLCVQLQAQKLRGDSTSFQAELFRQADPNEYIVPNAAMYTVFASSATQTNPNQAGNFAVAQLVTTDAKCDTPNVVMAQSGSLGVDGLNLTRGLTGDLMVHLDNANDSIMSGGSFTAQYCPALTNMSKSTCVPDGAMAQSGNTPVYTGNAHGMGAQQLVQLAPQRSAPEPDTDVVPPSVFQQGVLFALDMSTADPNNGLAFYAALVEPYKTAVMAFVSTSPGDANAVPTQTAAFFASPDQPSFQTNARAQAAQRVMLTNNMALGAPASVSQPDFADAALWALDMMNQGPQSNYALYLAGLQEPDKTAIRNFVGSHAGKLSSDPAVQADAAQAFPKNP